MFFLKKERLQNLKEMIYVFLCIVFLGSIMMFFSQEAIVIGINKYRSAFWDNGAHILDFCGSFWGYIIFFVGVFFVKKNLYTFILSGGSFFFSSLIVQVLKRFFFNCMRPHTFMSLYGYFPENLERYMSFPSGHTTTAFVMASIVLLTFRKNKTKIVWFVFAFLVLISRLYLGMHFYRDVYVGMVIGMGSVLLTSFFLMPIELFFRDKTRERRFSYYES